MQQPNWKPLENRIGSANCVGFMYMGRKNGINLYKHGITRSYLRLDDYGACYVKAGGNDLVPGDWDLEIAELKTGLTSLGATLETAYNEEFLTKKHQALREQGIYLITIVTAPEENTR